MCRNWVPHVFFCCAPFASLESGAVSPQGPQLEVPIRPRLLVFGTVAGAIVLFVWQTISHGLFKLPERGLRVFPNDSAAVAAHAIRAVAPENGMYFSAYGTFAAVDITSEYADKRQLFVSMMVKQFALNLAVVFLLTLLLDRLGGDGIVRTATTYSALALAYMGMIDIGNAIWWNFSTAWTLGNIVDQVIAFFLVGATLATVARRFGEPRIETEERLGVRAQGALGATSLAPRTPK